MRRLKARIDYTNLRNEELAVLAGKVSIALADNPHFTTTNTLIESFMELAADYMEKLQVAIRGGSKNDKELKDESRVKLLDAFRELAHLVNSVAQGSAAIISSTALIPGKPSSTLTKPGPIMLVRMGDGTVSGEISVRFQADKVATEYLIEVVRMLGDTESISWEQSYAVRNSRRFIIGNLEPGTRYFARVQGRNALGSGDWSESTSIIAR
ncbi:fibronectin type III domain-containing protein [Sphingobacterium bambusae]|uniref:Fibronectin type III domain-containing protein n=1 Tax=Sphingobacterium bambusae TaxID=662858 RepID=A0ABW6BA87_9SPHI|nr:fibronectin type III domain-containing protein [Sphingobacterium bambusae]WPL48578.1 fibronectin type III domain-containing protein [Sphingobacterium bambusae]